MKVAAAGDVYMGRFPHIPDNIAELKTADDRLDIGKVRAELRNYEDFIQFSSNDNIRTIAFALEFMRQFCIVCNKAAADPEADARVEAEKSVDRSLERKMDHEKFGYCRIDFDEHGGTLRARVGIANPKGIIGSVLPCCRRFAVDCARVLLYMQCGLKPVEVELAGRGDITDIFDEARWTEAKVDECKAVKAANERRESCDRRHGEYCSPSDPACPCYCGGKCVEAVLGDEWEAFAGTGDEVR
jgi:hypothetical protein